MARFGTSFSTTIQRSRPSIETTPKVLKAETDKKSGDNEAWTLVLLFCTCCSLWMRWSSKHTDLVICSTVGAFACLEPISFCSNSFSSFSQESSLSLQVSPCFSRREQGWDQATWLSLFLVSAIHLGKGTGLIPETDAAIIGSEKPSLVQVADMVEGEYGAVFDLSENSGIFWINEADTEDNRVGW